MHEVNEFSEHAVTWQMLLDTVQVTAGGLAHGVRVRGTGPGQRPRGLPPWGACAPQEQLLVSMPPSNADSGRNLPSSPLAFRAGLRERPA